MSMINPTRRTSGVAPPGQSNRRRMIFLIPLLFVLVILLFRACSQHENKYEKIAMDLTVALQNNDIIAVDKLLNAETATHMNRGLVGRNADHFAPLGKIKSVKEVTPADAAPRRHEFTVIFEKGVVHEDLGLDPEDKIVHFTPTLNPKK
jgi:hypothetical protein